MKRRASLVSLALALVAPALALAGGGPPGGQHTLDWPFYGNDLGGMRYQNVDQITPTNVAHLTPAWIFHTNVMNKETSFEAQPIEVAGTLYIASPHDHVFALDATTGALKWTYNPIDMPPLFRLALCCGQTSRGVAVGAGRVFVARMDAVLVALDAATGRVEWETRVADWHKKYAENMAPQVVAGMVLMGSSGGEYQKRGFLAAYDAATGRQLWRIHTTLPGASWAGASWQRGGGNIWVTPEVDPQLGLIYAHTGNASPDINGSRRAGDNLYTDALLAVDLRTGAVRWHFQEVHHDIWDYDTAQPAQLYTLVKNGQSIPVIGHANKDGFYFILDRRTGQPVYPVREAPVPTKPEWQHPAPTQPESTIVLIPQAVESTPPGLTAAPLFTPPQEQPLLEQPGAEISGPEWTPGAYSPRTRYAYIPAGGYSPWLYHATPTEVNSYGSTGSPPAVPGLKSYGLFDAVDTTTGRIAWQTRVPDVTISGAVVAGDLVFWGLDDGTFLAQDAGTGRILWRYHSHLAGVGGANGSGAAYVVGGREYVVMAFGGSSHVRGDTGMTASPLGDALIAFALPREGQSAARVVTAQPVQVPLGAPAAVSGVARPPAGSTVIELKTHDLIYDPHSFTVRAAARVAVHVMDDGLLPASFAVNLPTGAIGLAQPLNPGQETYLAFTAPQRPGAYEFFDAIQGDKGYAPAGIMRVVQR